MISHGGGANGALMGNNSISGLGSRRNGLQGILQALSQAFPLSLHSQVLGVLQNYSLPQTWLNWPMLKSFCREWMHIQSAKSQVTSPGWSILRPTKEAKERGVRDVDATHESRCSPKG